MEVWELSFYNSVSCDNADLQRLGGACKQKANGLGFADRDKAMALMGVSITADELQLTERGDRAESVAARIEARIDEYLEGQYAG